MQVFYVAAGRREPIVGVVGALQFDVIVSRLKTEYGVDVQIDPATYSAARWIEDATRVAALLPSLGGQIIARRRSARPSRAALRLGLGAPVLPAQVSGRAAAVRVARREVS